MEQPARAPEPGDADASMLDESMAAWEHEKRRVDERIGQYETLDAVGGGNGHTVRWTTRRTGVAHLG